MGFNVCLITYKGQTHNIAEWSRITGMQYAQIQQRYKRGWLPEDIFETSIEKHHTKECKGKYPSEITGTELYILWHRVKSKLKYRRTDHRFPDANKMCDEWMDDFQAFYDWAMENGWEPGLTLVRKDSAKVYSPENCLFVSKSESLKYRKSLLSRHWMSYHGEWHDRNFYAEYFGYSYDSFNAVVKKASRDLGAEIDSVEQLLPYINKHRYAYKGEVHSITEWSKILGVTRQCLYQRKNNGDAIEDMFSLSFYGSDR